MKQEENRPTDTPSNLPVFGEAMVTPGMVLSRGIAYYTQLLLSGCVTAFGAIRKRNRES